MIHAIKKFIGWKNKVKEETPPDVSLPNLGVSIAPPTPKTLPPVIVVDSDYSDKILNNQKNSVKYNNIERGYMGEKYLVVLDTTNRPEVEDRGLKGGLKNFYFVQAASPDQAKQMVLSTFARHPLVVKQIQYSLTVTALGKLASHITDQNPLWSYIPIRKGIVVPGQQATPPEQRLNPNNREEVIPMVEPPAPVTPPTQNDTPKMSEIPAEAQATNPMAAFMSPTLPNGQPNPMFAMFQAMSTMMNQQAKPVEQPPKITVTKGDPDNDPELAQRMAEVRATAVARHVNHDPSAMDDELSQAERKASQEIERFKSLDKGQQAAKGLTSVHNDVDPNLMAQMQKVMGRMGNTEIPEEVKAPKKKR